MYRSAVIVYSTELWLRPQGPRLRSAVINDALQMEAEEVVGGSSPNADHDAGLSRPPHGPGLVSVGAKTPLLVHAGPRKSNN